MAAHSLHRCVCSSQSSEFFWLWVFGFGAFCFQLASSNFRLCSSSAPIREIRVLKSFLPLPLAPFDLVLPTNDLRLETAIFQSKIWHIWNELYLSQTALNKPMSGMSNNTSTSPWRRDWGLHEPWRIEFTRKLKTSESAIKPDKFILFLARHFWVPEMP